MRSNRQLILVALATSMILASTACMLFTPARGPLQFEPAALPDAQLGVPYEARVTISGNATPAFMISAVDGPLPAGLTFEKVEGEDVGLLHGTPQAAGVFKFKVIVYCYGTNVSGQQGEKEYTLTVK